MAFEKCTAIDLTDLIAPNDVTKSGHGYVPTIVRAFTCGCHDVADVNS